MRWTYSLTVLILSILACTMIGVPQPLNESASVSEADIPTEPPAPSVNNTPPPSTIAAPVVSSAGITSLHMFSELNGWAIKENAIMRTTNGGSTWYNVSPLGVTEFGYGIANTFLNSMQAWILVGDAENPAGSGLLYRTNDGGITWIVYPVPFSGGDLAFVDENHGWMMAYLGIAAGSMGIAIYQTNDGGATWIQTYTNHPQADGSESLPFSGIKSNLTPLDVNIAWVGGVIYAPETFYFYKTIDGGRTWTPPTIPPAPSMQNTEVLIDQGPIFTSPTEAILPIRFTGETYRTGFYSTYDGGVSWNFISLMPGAGDVDFISPTVGFFWTGEQFFVTEDGAYTWKSINSDILFGDSFEGMDFVDMRTGWVWTYDQTGQQSLYKTVDGGETWFILGE